jgi:hypothetical protein
MELTEKEKDVAVEAYWRCDDAAATEVRAKSLYAAVSAVLEMRDRGHEALRSDYKKCGKVAQTFIAREGSFFPCALEEGHEEPCLQSGTCFRHGVYFGRQCPHWPTCVKAALTPAAPETPTEPQLGTCDFSDVLHDLRDCKAAWHRNWKPQAAQPPATSGYVSEVHRGMTMRCQSCGTEQWPQCPTCGAMMVEKDAAQPPADGQVVEQMPDGVECLADLCTAHPSTAGELLANANLVEAFKRGQQVCLSSRNLVALPDVEKAIRLEFCARRWFGAASIVELAADFFDAIRARLKPEPAKQERVTVSPQDGGRFFIVIDDEVDIQVMGGSEDAERIKNLIAAGLLAKKGKD